MSLPTFPPFEEPSHIPDALYAAETLAHRSQAAESYAAAIKTLAEAEMLTKGAEVKKAVVGALKALTDAVVEEFGPKVATRYVI